MIRINLLPVRAAQKKEQLRSQLVILAAGLVLTVVACAALYGSLSVKISTQRRELAAKRHQIRQLQKTIGEVTHFKKLKAELRSKLDVLAKLKAGKAGPVHLLDDLNKILPDKVWLTGFQDKGGRISVHGIGLNQQVVAQFMNNLEASPYYQNVELQLVQQATQDKVKVQKFNISCREEKPSSRAAAKP